jgi:hypothetical protein
MAAPRGLLFNAGSIISCAKALDQAMNQPEKLSLMANKAQEHVKVNYDWEKITTDNLSVYAEDFESDRAETAINSIVNKSQGKSSKEKVTQS